MYKRIIYTALFIFCCLSVFKGNATTNKNNILATANGVNIFESDINTQIAILKILDPNFKQTKSTRPTLLENLIEQELIIQDSKQYNFAVTLDDAHEKMAQFEKINKWPSGYIYNQADKSNLLSHQDIDLYFLQQTLVQRFIQMLIYSKVQVPEDELNQEYFNLSNLNGKTQYLIKEIFISTASRSQEEAKKLINRIYNNLKKGSKFAALASSYSDDFYSKNHQGMVGWVYETQISDEAKKLLSNAPLNKVTKPIFLDDGYYIFIVLEKQPVLYADLTNIDTSNQIKNFIRQKVSSEKAREAVNNYIMTLRHNAVIKYYKES